MNLLEVSGLRTSFFTRDGVVDAVDGLSFELRAGETLGVVGESGCGKSMSALSIMRLVPDPPGRITAGTVRLEGTDLLHLCERDMQRVRGNRIGMIFQEPMTSLNPVLTIGRQIAEAAMLHQGMRRAEAWERARTLLELVRLPDAAQRLHDYPHRLSGGMRQRVMIAMAICCDPALLIADEPTTALDVTIQAQIVRLLLELKARLGSAIMLITHDLGIVAEMCDRVVVMYAGRKVEEAPVRELYRNPRHPYTRGLLASVPRLQRGRAGGRRLTEIAGRVPAPGERARGCAFHPRCGLADARCREEAPPLHTISAGHRAACWHAERAA